MKKIIILSALYMIYAVFTQSVMKDYHYSQFELSLGYCFGFVWGYLITYGIPVWIFLKIFKKSTASVDAKPRPDQRSDMADLLYREGRFFSAERSHPVIVEASYQERLPARR